MSRTTSGREALIVSTARTPLTRSWRGALNITHGATMGGHVIKAAVERAGIDPASVEDVVMGCGLPEGATGANIARQAALRAGLPVSVSGVTVNRFCSSGLQAIASAAEHIMCGGSEVSIAGGVESMSMLPMGGHNLSPNPTLVEGYPDTYLNMGLTAENLAVKYQISREQADEFAVGSHRKAAAAIDAGRFVDEIVPLSVANRDLELDEKGRGKVRIRESVFQVDEGVRRETTLEALAKLRPAFLQGGTVTAGNSSQTTDGAAAALIMTRERAEALGLTPLARFVGFVTGGVAPEEMGIGPVVAIPKALKLAGLKIEDIDLIELNEAFAAQALSVIKVLGLDPARINVNGGALAIGHPLGCTGAKLTATLLHEMPRRKARYGVVTMCIGGGQGAAGLFEVV